MYGQSPQYNRPTTSYGRTFPNDPNPYGFLRSAKVPFDTTQQLAYSNRPIEFGTFFLDTEELKAQFSRDYRQTYDTYLNALSPGDRAQYGARLPDVEANQNASMYQLMLITNAREQHIATIERINKLLGQKTPEQVRSLSFVQLMQYLNTVQGEMQTKMNTWFYNQGIVVASNGIAHAFDGNTGVYYLDRYANLRSFAGRLREAKGNPWWEYALQQLSTGAGFGMSPGYAIASMIGMALIGAAQDGTNEYKIKQTREEERAREEREARKKQVKKPLMLTSKPPPKPAQVEPMVEENTEPPKVERVRARPATGSTRKDEIKDLIEGVEAL
jgi:uncharacterized protein (DUF2164 family)